MSKDTFLGVSHSKLTLLLGFFSETCSWKCNSDSDFWILSLCFTPGKEKLSYHCLWHIVSNCQARIMNTYWVCCCFSLRICASGWRGWTLLRASRSMFWRRLDPSVWWELHTPHCPGHLCRAGMWQTCVCSGARALQRVRWPGLGWRVQVWRGGAWALVLPQSALSRGHLSPQCSFPGCLFRWDADQDFNFPAHSVKVRKHEI